MTLEARNITKSFPGVKALSDVSIGFAAGEVHALCGENGAGKSTLMNILTGNVQPDSGELRFDGEAIHFKDPREAFSYGISIVYQHLSLCENMTVAENIFINRQPVNSLGFIQYERLHAMCSDLFSRLKLRIRTSEIVSNLSASDKQLVEIAKAIARNPRVLILDEPTASLTEDETRNLFDVIRSLKQEGVAIIYISHRLAEIFAIADEVTILKDGVFQGTFMTSELTREALIRRMVGRDLLDLGRKSAATDEVLLEVENLGGQCFHSVSFKLHRGEILGFAGLAGAGRTEIARAIFGADSHAGIVRVHQKVVNSEHPLDSIRTGMAYVPEDRKALGLFSDLSIAGNIISAAINKSTTGVYREDEAMATAEAYRKKLGIVAPDVEQKVRNLSGGNQQKVVLAKWLLTDPDILIVDEPTHGIDVGAKYEVYQILQGLAREGKGIILISSELPELLSLCDRIIVIRHGTVSATYLHEEATEERIMASAT